MKPLHLITIAIFALAIIFGVAAVDISRSTIHRQQQPHLRQHSAAHQHHIDRARAHFAIDRFRSTNEHTRVSHSMGSRAVTGSCLTCENGGVNHENDCTVCDCPVGFSGATCDRVIDFRQCQGASVKCWAQTKAGSGLDTSTLASFPTKANVVCDSCDILTEANLRDIIDSVRMPKTILQLTADFDTSGKLDICHKSNPGRIQMAALRIDRAITSFCGSIVLSQPSLIAHTAELQGYGVLNIRNSPLMVVGKLHLFYGLISDREPVTTNIFGSAPATTVATTAATAAAAAALGAAPKSTQSQLVLAPSSTLSLGPISPTDPSPRTVQVRAPLTVTPGSALIIRNSQTSFATNSVIASSTYITNSFVSFDAGRHDLKFPEANMVNMFGLVLDCDLSSVNVSRQAVLTVSGFGSINPACAFSVNGSVLLNAAAEVGSSSKIYFGQGATLGGLGAYLAPVTIVGGTIRPGLPSDTAGSVASSAVVSSSAESALIAQMALKDIVQVPAAASSQPSSLTDIDPFAHTQPANMAPALPVVTAGRLLVGQTNLVNGTVEVYIKSQGQASSVRSQSTFTVSGNSQLVIVFDASFRPPVQSSFTVVSADQGIKGSFSTVTVSNPGYSLTTASDGKQITVTLTSVPSYSSGASSMDGMTSSISISILAVLLLAHLLS